MAPGIPAAAVARSRRRRIASGALRFGIGAALLVAAAQSQAQAPAGALVRYSFEDDVDTGPDTFAVWRGAKGHVALTRAFHVSGYRAVEIRDSAGDGAFPELQGYFPVRKTGRLAFHFALLVTDPTEELNVALAGPRYFQVEKDGIGFWLGTRQGRFVHYSDSIPKKLFEPEAFVWYLVDVDYWIERGTYDLTIRREGLDEPGVALRDQPNAANQPGSSVDKFSFVGSPFADTSNATYYVDDVVLATDRPPKTAAFVAPGRRKLFVDAFLDHQKRLMRHPGCLPAFDPEDFGMTDDEMGVMAREGVLDAFERLVRGEEFSLEGFGGASERFWIPLSAMQQWNRGCAALAKGDASAALAQFEAAQSVVPAANAYPLAGALALVQLKRFAEADERLLQLATLLRDDPRYAATQAYVGIARDDLERAEQWLKDPAARVYDRDRNPWLGLLSEGAVSLERLRGGIASPAQEQAEETVIAEQYFYVQLWKANYPLASDYAARMTARLRAAGLSTSLWIERVGDALFFARELREAREQYAAARQASTTPYRLDLKLADVAFLEGDLRTERALRERYYGELHD